MRYLGLDNPAVPFPINITLINDTTVTGSYYNQSTFSCDQPLITQYENHSACACLVSRIIEDNQRRNDNEEPFILGLSKIMQSIAT